MPSSPPPHPRFALLPRPLGAEAVLRRIAGESRAPECDQPEVTDALLRIKIYKNKGHDALDIDNLTEDSLPDPGFQGIGDNKVRPSPQKILKVKLEVHEVVEGLLSLPELHQDIDVACRCLLAPHHRSDRKASCRERV